MTDVIVSVFDWIRAASSTSPTPTSPTEWNGSAGNVATPRQNAAASRSAPSASTPTPADGAGGAKTPPTFDAHRDRMDEMGSPHTASDDRLRAEISYLLGQVDDMAEDPDQQDDLVPTMRDIALREEVLKLRAIVRDLAADEPVAPIGHDEVSTCMLCGNDSDEAVAGHVEHAENCPWRRAVEWVDYDRTITHEPNDQETTP